MLVLDFRTIFFSFFVTNVIGLSVITLLFFQINKKFPGTGIILLSFVFNTLGTGLIFSQGVLPDWITMSVANTFILSCAVLMLVGLKQFFHKKSKPKYNYLFVSLFFIIHLYFVVIHPVLFVRVLISAFVLFYVFLKTTWFTLKQVPKNMRMIGKGVGFTYAAYCGIYLCRLAYLIIAHHPSNSYLQSNVYETWFIIANQVVFLFFAFNISRMYNKRLLINIATQEEKFRELIINSQDMIVLLDANGNQKYVSDSCENILGFKSNELINIPIVENMIHPDDQEISRKGLQDILKQNTRGGAQYRHRHKNGGWVYLEAFGNNQLNNPIIQSIILNVRDISVRKRIEKELIVSKEKAEKNESQLKELNATKDKFFSIIAHDLKAPFNSIIGFSEILCEQVKNKDYNEIKEYSTIIQQSSEKALELLLNLMEWSKSQTGKMEFNPEYIEIVHLINDVTELLTNPALQKSITLTKELPHNLIFFADKAMISTILRNLLSNAIKFTSAKGEIIISVHQNETDLLFSISDNGVGIDKANINKLFQIDESYTTTGTQNEKGTGLGLILCKDFIDKHNGKIWVESESGVGSTFSFTIPLQKI